MEVSGCDERRGSRAEVRPLSETVLSATGLSALFGIEDLSISAKKVPEPAHQAEHFVELRPAVLRTADPEIDELPDHVPASLLGKLPKRINLKVGLLIEGRATGIKSNRDLLRGGHAATTK